MDAIQAVLKSAISRLTAQQACQAYTDCDARTKQLRAAIAADSVTVNSEVVCVICQLR